MSLGNVLAVAYATQREKLTFLEEEDKVGTGTGPGLTSADAGRRNRPEQGKGRGFRPSSAASPLCDLGSLEPVSPAGKQWRQPFPRGLLPG